MAVALAAQRVPEPLTAAQIHIILPALSVIRTVAERMKAIGDTVTISANLRGQFQLRVETDAASVQTEWRGLTIPELRTSVCSGITDLADASTQETTASEAAARDPDRLWHVTIDIKSLMRFLGAHVLVSTVIACASRSIGGADARRHL